MHNLGLPTVIRLISLNIERDKHLDRLLPFLRNEDADVLCLQEVLKGDLPVIADSLGYVAHFAPSVISSRRDGEADEWGVAILSRLDLHDIRKDYYFTGGRKPGDVKASPALDQDGFQRVLLSASIGSASGPIRIGTTHFTWTPDGRADDLQRRDIKQLLNTLSDFKDIVFCGDFNAPRGGEIFDILAAHYKDWLPETVTSTLDPDLHKAKGLELAVDSIFSTPDYRVADFEVISGVSDHRALVASICRAPSADSN